MRYLIYNIEKQAQERCDKAFVDMNCTDSNTTAYAIPIKHTTEDLWAIDISLEYLFTEEEINSAVELTEDWFPKLDILLNNRTTFMCLKCNIESEIIKINERYICVCDKCNTLIYSKLTLPA